MRLLKNQRAFGVKTATGMFPSSIGLRASQKKKVGVLNASSIVSY